MKILLSKKEKPSIDQMIEFLRTLSEEEQKEINIMLKGYELGIKRGVKKSKEVMLAAM